MPDERVPLGHRPASRRRRRRTGTARRARRPRRTARSSCRRRRTSRRAGRASGPGFHRSPSRGAVRRGRSRAGRGAWRPRDSLPRAPSLETHGRSAARGQAEYHRSAPPPRPRGVAPSRRAGGIRVLAVKGAMAPEATDPNTSQLMQVSRALMRVYKEYLGRGPDRAHTHYAGADAIVCFLEGTLTPVERTLTTISAHQRLRRDADAHPGCRRGRDVPVGRGDHRPRRHCIDEWLRRPCGRRDRGVQARSGCFALTACSAALRAVLWRFGRCSSWLRLPITPASEGSDERSSLAPGPPSSARPARP